MQTQFLTDRGQVRDHNEDSGGVYYNVSGQILAIIADGMGGHQAGDVASEMAVSTLKSEWKDLTELSSPEQTEDWLSDVLQNINTSIYEQAKQHEEYAGMGTTVVVAISGEDFMTIGHIGDSRCYLYNENGFNQVTEDHSLVNELVRTGQITEEDAKFHPRKNIVLKALGTEPHVLADIQSISFEQGDRLLLCSDGLTDKLSNGELSDFVQSSDDIKETAQKMIDLANERGGEDNISLILIRHQPQEKVGEGHVRRSPIK